MCLGSKAGPQVVGHKKPFHFIAQAVKISDSLNLSPMQPWMSPWGSRPPTSPPLRHCSSGTHHCRRWRAMSLSSHTTQVRWGSVSAHLYLISLGGQQLVRSRAVPHPQTPAPPLQVPWQVLSTAPHQAPEHSSPHIRGLGPSRFADWPTSSSPGASKHPSHRNPYLKGKKISGKYRDWEK